MTVCLYMSPPVDHPTDYEGAVLPVIMADTMATFRLPAETQSILPTNMTPENIRTLSRTKIVRKLNIYNEYAWACAGDAGRIESLCGDVRYLASEW